MRTRLKANTYAAYSIGCAAVWAVILFVTQTRRILTHGARFG